MRNAPKAGVRHLRTVREILASHVPTLYNVIALLCAAVLLAAGDSFQLSFLPMALLHAALCIGAELCFRRAMRRLEAPEPPVVVLAGEGHETRPGAAVAYFRAEGVDVRLLTGDTPEAAAAIARALHLEGPLVDCAGLSDEALAAATAYAGVFASATAAQKAKIVAALRAAGRCVGMVGDGVNDVAAFHTADCSVAMAHGCEAGRSAAQLVLLDENLLSLPDIVREGRSIIGSVTRTSELFVKKSLTSMIVLLIALITPLEYPFLPRQLTLVALFTIGLPALALTFERESAPAHGHFVGSVFFEAVPGTLLSLLCVVTGMVCGGPLGLSAVEHTTLCVYAYALSGMLVLLHICRPFDRSRALLCAAMAAGLSLSLVLLREPLSLVLPTPAMLLVLLPLIVLGYPMLFLLVRGAERVSHRRHARAQARREAAEEPG